MKKQSVILVPVGTRCTLCNEFGVSYATVKKALSGIVKTPTHLAIRERALALGGVPAPDESTAAPVQSAAIVGGASSPSNPTI